MRHIRTIFLFLGIFLLHFVAKAQVCDDLSAFKDIGPTERLSLVVIDINPDLLCEQLDVTHLEDKFHFYTINISELEELYQIAPEFKKVMKNKFELPTLLFLDRQKNIIQTFHGNRSSHEIQLLLSYFGNEYYENIPWCKFKKIHQGVEK